MPLSTRTTEGHVRLQLYHARPDPPTPVYWVDEEAQSLWNGTVGPHAGARVVHGQAPALVGLYARYNTAMYKNASVVIGLPYEEGGWRFFGPEPKTTWPATQSRLRAEGSCPVDCRLVSDPKSVRNEADILIWNVVHDKSIFDRTLRGAAEWSASVLSEPPRRTLSGSHLVRDDPARFEAQFNYSVSYQRNATVLHSAGDRICSRSRARYDGLWFNAKEFDLQDYVAPSEAALRSRYADPDLQVAASFVSSGCDEGTERVAYLKALDQELLALGAGGVVHHYGRCLRNRDEKGGAGGASAAPIDSCPASA